MILHLLTQLIYYLFRIFQPLTYELVKEEVLFIVLNKIPPLLSYSSNTTKYTHSLSRLAKNILSIQEIRFWMKLLLAELLTLK